MTWNIVCSPFKMIIMKDYFDVLLLEGLKSNDIYFGEKKSAGAVERAVEI